MRTRCSPARGRVRLWPRAGGEPDRTIDTDREGRFCFERVPPGEYGVVAYAPGYAASDAQDDQVAVTVPEAGGVATRDVALAADTFIGAHLHGLGDWQLINV